ncbi:hypothetical protein AVEN_109611-1, partial [Araneus ventricosus]
VERCVIVAIAAQTMEFNGSVCKDPSSVFSLSSCLTNGVGGEAVVHTLFSLCDIGHLDTEASKVFILCYEK